MLHTIRIGPRKVTMSEDVARRLCRGMSRNMLARMMTALMIHSWNNSAADWERYAAARIVRKIGHKPKGTGP